MQVSIKYKQPDILKYHVDDADRNFYIERRLQNTYLAHLFGIKKPLIPRSQLEIRNIIETEDAITADVSRKS